MAFLLIMRVDIKLIKQTLLFAGAGMSSVLYKSEAAQALAVGSEVITADILSKHVLFADKYGAVYDAMKSDSSGGASYTRPSGNSGDSPLADERQICLMQNLILKEE